MNPNAANDNRIRSVWTDPEFHSMGIDDRRSLMTNLDPEFALLPADEQNKLFDQAYKAYYVKRLPPPPQESDDAMAASGLPPAMPAQPQMPDMGAPPVPGKKHPAARAARTLTPQQAGAELDRLATPQPVPGRPAPPAWTQPQGPQGSFLNSKPPIPGTEQLGLPQPALSRPMVTEVPLMADATKDRVPDPALDGFMQGIIPSTVGTAGGLSQWLGHALGSGKLEQIGEDLSRFSRGATLSFADQSLQVDPMEDPGVLKNPDWWVYQLGQGLGSMAPMYATGGMAGKGVEALIGTGKISPGLAAAAARWTPKVTGGITEGLTSGALAFDEAIQAGRTPQEAAREAAIVAAGTAATSIPSLELGVMGKGGANSKALKSLVSEGGQEMLQTGIENAAAQYRDPNRPLTQGMVSAGISGGLTGVAVGHMTGEHSAADEPTRQDQSTESNLFPPSIRVDGEVYDQDRPTFDGGRPAASEPAVPVPDGRTGQPATPSPVELPTQTDPLLPSTTPTGYPTLVPDGKGGFVESGGAPIADVRTGNQGLAGASLPTASAEPAPEQVPTETASEPPPLSVEGAIVPSDVALAVDSPAPENDTKDVAITIPKHEFSSTQVSLPEAVAGTFRKVAIDIPDSDLAENGRELEPHVTVKYGLHTEQVDDVAKILANEPPVRVKLGKVSLFENEDADVLKVDIDSTDLHRLNKKIADALPHTDTHPTYQPHATIAYLKPGKGKQYKEALEDAFAGAGEFTLPSVTFSSKTGEKIEIPLTGKPKKHPAARGAKNAGEAAMSDPAPQPTPAEIAQPTASVPETADLPKSDESQVKPSFKGTDSSEKFITTRAKVDGSLVAVNITDSRPDSELPQVFKGTGKHSFSIDRAEWERTGKGTGNADYHRMRLIERALGIHADQLLAPDVDTDTLDASARLSRVADSVMRAVKIALGEAPTKPPKHPAARGGKKPTAGIQTHNLPGGGVIQSIMSPGAWASSFEPGEMVEFTDEYAPGKPRIQREVVRRMGDGLRLKGHALVLHGDSTTQADVKRIPKASTPVDKPATQVEATEQTSPETRTIEGSNEPSGTKETESAGTAHPGALGGTLSDGDKGSPASGDTGARSDSDSRPSGDSTRAGDSEGSELSPGGRTGKAPVEVPPGPRTDEGSRNPGSTRLERDYRIPDGRKVSGTPEKRAKDNIEAIKLLRELQKVPDRVATPEEQEILAGYVGWGAVPQIFAAQTLEWRELQSQLKDIVSEEEFSDARRSTTNAHYTSDLVVDGIWSAMKHLGATPGMSWLEPAVGVGNFFGRQPVELLEGARRLGIDKDALSAQFAKYLYPDSSIENTPLEKAELPRDYFDAAVSNVPFGDFGVYDPEFTGGKKFLSNPIHNYFFARSLTVVRPGGIVAFVTSRYTMDGYDKPHKLFREWVNKQADFLGAVRLPASAFKQNAGTDVITDVIFLRKRLPGAEPAGKEWTETAQKRVSRKPRADGQHDPYGMAPSANITLNEWYSNHPEAVIGQEFIDRGQFSQNDYKVDGDVTPEKLQEVLKSILPADAFQKHETGKASKAVRVATVGGDSAKLGALFFDDKGTLYRKTTKGSAEPLDVSPGDRTRIKGQLGIRDALIELHDAERADKPEADLNKLRKVLNDKYDQYVSAAGVLSSRANIAAIYGDPDAPLLVTLERDFDPKAKTAVKAPIFTRRMLPANRPVEKAEGPQEALAVSLNEKGRIDWEHMTGLTGMSAEQMQQDLAGIVYEDPMSKSWQTADEYLSGAVRRKLREAKAIAKLEPRFAANVKALEAVQPEDLPPSQIRVRLGVTWVPMEVYQKFAQHALQTPNQPKVHYTGEEWVVDSYGGRDTGKWNTNRVSARDVLNSALNMRAIKVYDKDSKGNVSLNTSETIAAQAKVQEIQEEFEQWLFGGEQGPEMARRYNDLMNDLVRRQFDGSHLTLPGMSRAILRGGDLEPYQKAAVWRQISQRNVMLAHAPGGGKTFEMIAAGMEMKRIGLIKRPMYVVPNTTLTGWQEQFTALYPSARVLVFSEKDLEKSNRQRVMAMIATGEWDAVVVPHSSFQFLRVGDDVFERHFQELSDLLEEQIMEAEGAGLDSRFIKRLEKAKERLLEQLEERRNAEKQDQTVSWEQLGIDQLFVDESHEYKKLGFATKQAGTAGIDQAGNQKTFDLLMKVRYTQEKGRGVVFATGTPVTNTMGELFSIMRYLIEPELKARGLSKFDEWSAAFGRTKAVFERKVEGGGYRMKQRFAKFVNLPELGTLYRMFADVVTSDMLDIPRPKIKGGERTAVVTEMTDEQTEYMATLEKRGAAIRSDPRKALPDNMLAIFTDATKATLDIRLVDSHGGDDPQSRLNSAADNVAKIWKETKGNDGTQLIFSDMGLPVVPGRRKSLSAKNTGFSVYDELIKKLVERGIPRDQIAHAYEAKNKIERAQLFRKVNQGKVRVLIGSTAKIGQGVNVQERVAAMHHLDIPHRPSDLEQREARGIRQGNKNPEVEIFTYVTRGSLDELKLGGVLRKAKFINDYQKGDMAIREAEDVDEHSLIPSLEQFAALASGDPRVFRKMEVDNEIDRLSRVRSSWRDQVFSMRRELAGIPQRVDQLRRVAKAYRELQSKRDAAGRVWKVRGQKFEGDGIRDKVADAVHEIASGAKGNTDGVDIGTAFGIKITAKASGLGGVFIYFDGLNVAGMMMGETPIGTFTRIENTIKNLQTYAEEMESKVPPLEKQMVDVQAEVDKPWKYETQYQALLQEQSELIKALGGDKDDGAGAVSDEDIADDSVEAEEDAEEVDEESDTETKSAHPAARSRRKTQSGAVKLDFLQPWKWAQKGHQPETPKITFLDENVEERFQASGQSTEAGLSERIAESLEKFKSLGRVYQHLQADKYHKLIFELQRFKKQSSITSTDAVHNIEKVTRGLDSNQYDLLRKKIVLDDLLATLEDWQKDGTVESGQTFEMAFGLDPEKLKAEHAHITAAADADDMVSKAVGARDHVWAGIRENFIDSMETIGVDMKDTLSRKSYFRHRVLEHAQAANAGKSGKVATPVGRSYQKRRGVNALDYSTSYIESEYEVMSQILHDTAKAKFIGWLQNSEHNILANLKAAARDHNARMVMPYFEEMAAEMNRGNQNPQAPQVTGAQLFRQILNSKQARAIQDIAKEADNLPDGNGKWRAFLDELSQAYAMHDEDAGEDMPVDMGQLLRYANWLLKSDHAGKGSIAAASLYKGMREKKLTMKQIAGKKYVDTADVNALVEKLAPEGHALFYAREGNVFYTAQTVQEQLAEKILDAAGKEIGVKAEDLKKAIVRGGKYTPFVLPQEVVDTLEELAPKPSKDVAAFLEKASAGTLGAWKQWQLINPARVIKYNVRNLTGDAEATFVGNPKAFKRIGKAAKDLYGYYKRQEFTPELRAWFERGGFQSNLQAQEMGDLQNITALEKLMSSHQDRPKHPLARAAKKIDPRKYFQGARLATDFREGILRYANFLEYADQTAGGKTPDNYGASLPHEVNALEDPFDKAYKLSNDLMGAYDEVSTIGRHIRRHWIPFWSFQELNARRYWRLLKNAARDEELASAVGRKMLGATAKHGAMTTLRVGTFGVMAMGFWAMLEAWNRLKWPEEEKSLREDIRKRPHIILGRTKDGQVLYFSRLGNLPDLWEWIDFPELPARIARDWLNGKTTALQAAKDFLWEGPIEKAILSGHPLPKMVGELATGRSIFPSLTNPRTIHDRWEYLADSFSLGDAYRAIEGKPRAQSGPLGMLAGAAIYSADPGESAYYDSKDLVSRWSEEHGKPGTSGAGTAKSEAVRLTKVALRKGDKEAFAKYLAEYAAMGGTPETFKASIKSLHPLAGLNEAERKEFYQGLNEEDRGRLLMAMKYYDEVFTGPRLGEFVADAAPVVQKRLAHPAARAARK